MPRVRLGVVVALAASVALLSGYVSLAASGGIRQLTNTTASNLRPALSPDGKRVAFQSNRDGSYHIYLMDADGANVRPLTRGDVDDRHPAWSPDGKHIAIDSGDAHKREIWIVEVATGARTQLTRLGAIATFPSWSPDGKRIGFYLYREGAMGLWLAARDGSGAAPLERTIASEANSQCTFACHSPAWSRDGSYIAVTDGDMARILLMSATGAGGATAVSPDGEKSHFPQFLDDGRIVYVTEHISQLQSYTDLWAVDPRSASQRTAIAKGVLAQGPFEFRGDGGELLFASPRTGNFEIYAVTLDDEGKVALATKSAGARAAGTPTPASGQDSGVLGVLAQGAPLLVGLGALAALAVGIGAARRGRRPPASG